MKHKIFIFLLMVPTICAVAQQMRVEPGTKITITSGNTLDVSAGNLVLKSNNSGDASLLNRGSITFSGEGQAVVERYIGAWSGDDHGWHLLSSPIAGQNIQPEFVTDPPNATQDFYKWDEVSGYWINSKLENGSWNPAFDETFTPGAGYLVAYSEDVTKNFTGVLNNDDIVRNGLTYTLSSLATGWHLLGNPYPCALEWNQTTGITGWNISNIDGVCKT